MSYPSKTEFDNLRNSLPLTYQTRGNYAFRTDLASNINTALRNVNKALAFYAKKTDIPIVPANVATKTDLAGYALASDLSKYQPAGRYVSPSELEAYQAKGDYALAKDLVSYAKSSDLANFQPKGEYALAADLASYAKESSLASYQPKGDYAVKSDLGGYQPKGDYALAADLTSYAKESSLASYQPKGDYAVKSDLAGYQPKGDYAVKSELASYQPKGDYALQTDLVGYQPKGNYQTAGNYALKTELANYALAKDFANLQPKGNYQTAGNYALQTDLVGYQPKGNYQTAGNYALQPTAGNYALQSELAGYVKTAGASTFSGQATFDKNAIVKTEGTTPFQVLGTGGLRVSGGNLTVTGAQATFENNATVTTSAGKPFEVKGAGGIDVDSISIAAAGTAPTGNITGKGRLHITGPELLYVLNKNGLVIGKERDGNGNLDVQGDTTIRGNASIAGSLSANHVFLESGGDPSLRLGPSIKDIGNARLNVQDKAGTYMRFFYGPNETGSITHESDSTSLNVGKVNSTNLSTTNASITNLTIGNFNMTGAPTFGALATFKSNATVETTEGKPFQVTGKGGLKVGGDANVTGNVVVSNDLHLGGKNGWIMHTPEDNERTTLYIAPINPANNQWNWGAQTEFLNDGGLNVNKVNVSGNASIAGSATFKGASTFNAQATFEKNATVTTTANNPFQVKGDGGLKIAAGGLVVGGEANVTGTKLKLGGATFDSTILGDNQNWIRMSADNGNSYNYGLAAKNLWTDGTLDAKTANVSGNASIAGSATFKGASTFNAQATFEKNATVTTTANNPFQVKGDGGLKIAAGGLVVGGDANVSGGLSANHVFLESGGDPALRLGPGIKDIGNARLNVQDKAGTYMRFFYGTKETGSITHESDSTSLNVNKVNVNSARFNTTGATTFFPGHTLALDSAGVVGGSFIVKSDAVKGNTKVGINNENPTSSLDVVGSVKIGNTSGSAITINSETIDNKGRLHISGGELLYLLNKSGVIIGKDWGGNGNLNVQGNLNVGEDIAVNTGKKITIRDGYHGIVYSSDVDGPHIFGYSGGKFSTTNPEKDGVKKRDVLKWGVDADNRSYLKIGNWTITDEGGNLTFYKDGQGGWIQDGTGKQARMNY